MAKQITVRANIQLTAQVERGKITLSNGRTFQVGDRAMHDYYNIAYYGEITSITEKTVTVRKDHAYGTKSARMAVSHFLAMNWDFDQVTRN